MADETMERSIAPAVTGRVVSGVYNASPGNRPEEWFGPGSPLPGTAPPSVAGRRTDYPVAYNLAISPRQGESVSFAQLRTLADSCDLLRIAIETRKDQMGRLRWAVRPRQGARMGKNRLTDITRMLTRPDRENGWDAWLRMLMEDLLVVDAPCIYPRHTRGGALCSLEIMDGATITRKLRADGRTPTPPDTAYQQVLHGVPAVDYTANELIYRPRNLRSWRVYGFSPVEQILMTVNIQLRRQMHQLQFYTEGSVPEAMIGVPESWSPDQIRQFQEYWDWLLSGDTAARRRARFVPGGLNVRFTKESVLKDEFDEWLARVVCYALSLPPTTFIRQVNRATAEQADATGLSEGLEPLKLWVKSLMDDILARWMAAPGAEFVWLDDRGLDPKVQAEIDEIYVRIGVKTPRQVAAERGMT